MISRLNRLYGAYLSYRKRCDYQRPLGELHDRWIDTTNNKEGAIVMCRLAIICAQKNRDDYRVILMESWTDQLRPKYQMRGQLETHYVNEWEGFEFVEEWEIPWSAEHPIMSGEQDFVGFPTLEEARQFIEQLHGEQVGV